jgi:tetratricopeptide (TPR) repeat protein/predicted Ser/Thr protein kinase
MTPEPEKPDETVSLPAGNAFPASLPETDQYTVSLIRERYTVLGRLGRGGMGEVFLCRDSTLDLLVAVKFPTHDLSGRFLDEARTASRLNHPNIARLYHFDYEEGGRPFIVMEYVEGQCLSEFIRQGPIPAARAVEIIDAVLAALEEAHAHGIIHRDIKPRNIMLTPSGTVKVLDFGLAKRIGSREDGEGQQSSSPPDPLHHTAVGKAVGTARYMAPEQARGQADLDERCDIFAAGTVLFECLTGRPAFEKGVTDPAQAALPSQERPVPPPSTLAPNVPAKLDAVVAKALAIDREHRYRSAAEMRAALPRKGGAGLLLQAARESLKETARSPLRLAAVAAATALLYFLPGFYHWGRRMTEYHPPEAVRLYQAGLSAIRDGAYYSASRALERAVAIDPRFHMARARLAESLFELEYTDRANSEMLKILGEGKPRGDDALLVEALRQTFSGNLDGAVKSYRDVADHASGSEKAQALVDLGRAFEHNNKSKEALEQFQAAIKLNSAYPAAFLRSGILLGRLKGNVEAEEAFRRAEELYQTLSNTEGQAEVWYQRGRLATAQRCTREAMDALDHALSLARTSGSVYQQIQATLQLSAVLQLLARTGEAEKTARDAIEMARKAGISNLAARGQINLGNSFLVAGDYAKAESAFEEAREYARRHELRFSEARARFSLASVYSQRGQSELVIEETADAVRFFRQGGFNREVVMCLQLRTRALRQMGRFQEALETAQSQLNALGPDADKAQRSDLEDVIGSILAALERYPEAMKAYQGVEQVARSLNDKVGIGYAVASQARVAGRMGDFDLAVKHLKEAGQIAGAPEAGLKALATVIAALDADLELSRGRNAEAAARAKRLLERASEQQARTAVEATFTLALARSRSGSGRFALETARKAASMADAYREPYLKWRAAAVLAEAALAAGDATTAREAAGRAVAAFSAAGQLDSGWRAHALLAEALRRLGDPNAAGEAERQAKTLLERMRTSWPADAFARYLSRPDLAGPPYQRAIAKETADVRTKTPFAVANSGPRRVRGVFHCLQEADPRS